MILVDTSIWVDHLRTGRPALARLLENELVLCHPWVVGELALGHLFQRHDVISLLGNLPQANVATNAEVMTLINRRQLYGLGIGHVDAQLLAATQLSANAALWSADRLLAAVASRLGCAADPETEAAERP